ncbi:ribonuclease P protein subunit p25-like protein isoform X2 [Prunus yedoensis var. nudiflora]|uniref:Ribonuclease P protein subunit p25-like protein isoform X2 n=1 Tax=Prunus yedoensis var. nudiflora TaxID=2094558 RepID=A0A314Y2P4_PRUYE|nr:ribonuclease P protein subunit p25-like protein isoform X2 [Prunus yedoensis var. nudiflora]
MDKFQRVEKPRAEAAPINENEIRITAQGRMRNYITYATTLLQEKGSDEIILKAMGRAINKTRRIVGLHQNTSIGSIDIIDVYEPLEEGLDRVESTRHVSMITITLSKTELHTSSTGYQPPLPADQVKPLNDFEDNGEGSPRFRGRGRGGRGQARDRGNYNGVGDYNGDGWDRGRGYGGRGRGRGRGGSFRGRGRGYGQSGGYYDYVEGAPAQGRAVFFATHLWTVGILVKLFNQLSDSRCPLKVWQGAVEAEEEVVVMVVIPDWKDKHPLLEQMFTRYVCGLEKKNDIWDACSAFVVVKFADISMGTVFPLKLYKCCNRDA